MKIPSSIIIRLSSSADSATLLTTSVYITCFCDRRIVYNISNSNVQLKSKILLVLSILSVRILCIDMYCWTNLRTPKLEQLNWCRLHHFKDMCSLLCNLTDFLYNNTRWVVFAILQFIFTKNLNALNWWRHTHILLESSESGNRA